jgi:hypothetical protein
MSASPLVWLTITSSWMPNLVCPLLDCQVDHPMQMRSHQPFTCLPWVVPTVEGAWPSSHGYLLSMCLQIWVDFSPGFQIELFECWEASSPANSRFSKLRCQCVWYCSATKHEHHGTLLKGHWTLNCRPEFRSWPFAYLVMSLR